MMVKIDDEYYMTADNYCYALIKRGKKSDAYIGYYTKPEHCIEKVMQLKEKEATAKDLTLMEFLKEIKKIREKYGVKIGGK